LYAAACSLLTMKSSRSSKPSSGSTSNAILLSSFFTGVACSSAFNPVVSAGVMRRRQSSATADVCAGAGVWVASCPSTPRPTAALLPGTAAPVLPVCGTSVAVLPTCTAFGTSSVVTGASLLTASGAPGTGVLSTPELISPWLQIGSYDLYPARI